MACHTKPVNRDVDLKDCMVPGGPPANGPFVDARQDCAILKRWIGQHLNPSLLRDFCWNR